MGTGEFMDGLASHPGRSKNIPSRFMQQKAGKNFMRKPTFRAHWNVLSIVISGSKISIRRFYCDNAVSYGQTDKE